METPFTVYGLRLKGDKEVRYIGQTNGLVFLRLNGHLSAAAKRRHNLPLCEWLAENGSNVEAFKIGYADTRAEAIGIEKAIIALCLRLEHRLLNQRPAELFRGRVTA
jgi:hypothetical protein